MQEAARAERISYLQNFFSNLNENTPLDLCIPSEVQQDYQPSGKSELMTIPILLVTGVLGMGVGYGVSWLVSAISFWVFEAFNEAGFCLTIIYLPAGLLYMLAPLSIALGGGMGVAAGGTISSCRSPQMGLIMGVVIGLLSTGAAIYATLGLYDGLNFIANVLDGLEMGVSTVLTMIGLGLFYFLTNWQDHYVWYGILAVLSVVISLALGREAGTNPYCEQVGKFLKEKVVKNYQINQIPRLLIGLLNRDEKALTDLEHVASTAKERLDVIIWSTEGFKTNILEVKAYYKKIEYKKNGAKESEVSRLVLSESLDSAGLVQVSKLLDIKPANLKNE